MMNRMAGRCADIAGDALDFAGLKALLVFEGKTTPVQR